MTCLIVLVAAFLSVALAPAHPLLAAMILAGTVVGIIVHAGLTGSSQYDNFPNRGPR